MRSRKGVEFPLQFSLGFWHCFDMKLDKQHIICILWKYPQLQLLCLEHNRCPGKHGRVQRKMWSRNNIQFGDWEQSAVARRRCRSFYGKRIWVGSLCVFLSIRTWWESVLFLQFLFAMTKVVVGEFKQVIRRYPESWRGTAASTPPLWREYYYWSNPARYYRHRTYYPRYLPRYRSRYYR